VTDGDVCALALLLEASVGAGRPGAAIGTAASGVLRRRGLKSKIVNASKIPRPRDGVEHFSERSARNWLSPRREPRGGAL
jgi:hypothetical protein